MSILFSVNPSIEVSFISFGGGRQAGTDSSCCNQLLLFTFPLTTAASKPAQCINTRDPPQSLRTEEISQMRWNSFKDPRGIQSTYFKLNLLVIQEASGSNMSHLSTVWLGYLVFSSLTSLDFLTFYCDTSQQTDQLLPLVLRQKNPRESHVDFLHAQTQMPLWSKSSPQSAFSSLTSSSWARLPSPPSWFPPRWANLPRATRGPRCHVQTKRRGNLARRALTHTRLLIWGWRGTVDIKHCLIRLAWLRWESLMRNGVMTTNIWSPAAPNKTCRYNQGSGSSQTHTEENVRESKFNTTEEEWQCRFTSKIMGATISSFLDVPGPIVTEVVSKGWHTHTHTQRPQ